MLFEINLVCDDANALQNGFGVAFKGVNQLMFSILILGVGDDAKNRFSASSWFMVTNAYNVRVKCQD